MANLVALVDLDAEFGSGEIASLALRSNEAVSRAQDWAEGIARNYLGSAGITPPSPTPPELVGFICDLIRWRLYDDAVTDLVLERYEKAIAWFSAIASGRIRPTWAAQSNGGMAWTKPERIFTRYD